MGKIISDTEIGKKIREFRHQMGLTQEGLAEKLDITFQQVQKYERGITKVNLFRLQQLSKIMKVPISAFFEESSCCAYQLSEDEKHLLEAFRSIKSDNHKSSVIDIARGLATPKS